MSSIRRRINPKQMEGYIAKLQLNMRKYLEQSYLWTPEERLEFIRQQYILLRVVNKVLSGKMYLTGCFHPSNK
jgi:hypothetical protein